MAGPCQFQQHPAADHVAQGAVGLSPSPRLAQAQRELPPVGPRMLRDEPADKLHVRGGNHSAPIAKFSFHAPERSRVENRTQESCAFFLNSSRSPTATPAPPGWRSGRPPPTTPAVDAPPDSAPPRAHSALPATSENALWKAASARARILGHHRQDSESPYRVGYGKRTARRKKDRQRASPDTTVPA